MVDTSQIQNWRSIVTLVVFVITNLAVLFPFPIPIWIPRPFSNAVLNILSRFRVIPPRRDSSHHKKVQDGKTKSFVRLNLPINFITAPLIADLFLLAISAIGKEEVSEGTIGADGIIPLDIMAFFITLAYIAISVDASGLIRYLAFKVVQKGGKYGHRLFFYLYAFFFGLGSFIGNDPIILSGTAFLAYMTRVSSNIIHPRAWIHTQFAVANTASAILVSSNPTNLVLAGAFQIRFIDYTANMIVPVVATAIVLFPFLLYIVFADESLIPLTIKIHELPEELRRKKPVNPNIPHARGTDGEIERLADDEKGKLLSLEEVMNPFLDKGGAGFGACIMATTLITLLALNATHGGYPVFWVTLPAAFIMLCWDLSFGWLHRHETRDIARKGKREIERARAGLVNGEDVVMREQERRDTLETDAPSLTRVHSPDSQLRRQSDVSKDDDNLSPADELTLAADHPSTRNPSSKNYDDSARMSTGRSESLGSVLDPSESHLGNEQASPQAVPTPNEDQKLDHAASKDQQPAILDTTPGVQADEEKEMTTDPNSREVARRQENERATLVSLITDAYQWAQVTFPTVMAVFAHLPFPLVPFALSMFVLVQALVTKGWVEVFAYGWDHWVNKTGTIGSIGGMGFLSVILCNFAGTNIGTTILLSRVVQQWTQINKANNTVITDRTFWGTVYGMALGVNYGAYSTAFSASLAGLLWRDILARKHIRVRRLEFARVNLPIIATAMAVGSAVLVGEVYVIRTNNPHPL